MNHILRVFNFTTERNVTNSKFYTDNLVYFMDRYVYVWY